MGGGGVPRLEPNIGANFRSLPTFQPRSIEASSQMWGSLSQKFTALSAGIGKVLETRMTERAKESGLAAGLDPDFDVNGLPKADSAVAKAYREGALETYVSETQLSLHNKLADLKVEHADNPFGYSVAAQNLLDGASAGMPAENKAALRLSFGKSIKANEVEMSQALLVKHQAYNKSVNTDIIATLEKAVEENRQPGNAAQEEALLVDVAKLRTALEVGVKNGWVTPPLAKQKLALVSDLLLEGQVLKEADRIFQAALAANGGDVDAAEVEVAAFSQELYDGKGELFKVTDGVENPVAAMSATRRKAVALAVQKNMTDRRVSLEVHKQDISEQLAAINKGLSEGLDMSAPITGMLGVAQNAEDIQKLQELQGVNTYMKQFKGLSANEQENQLQSLRSELESNPTSETIALYTRASEFVSHKRDALNSGDALDWFESNGMAGETGVVDFGQMPSDQLQGIIAARRKLGQSVKQQEGITMSMLKTDELNALKELFESSDRAGKEAVADKLMAVMSPGEVVATLSKVVKEAGPLVGMVMTRYEDKTLSGDVATGLAILQAGTLTPPKDEDLLTQFRAYLGNVTMPPEHQRQLLQIIKPLYVRRVALDNPAGNDFEEIDGGKFKTEMERLVGPKIKRGAGFMGFGGTETLSFRKPGGKGAPGGFVSQDEFQGLVMDLTASENLLIKAGGNELPRDLAGRIIPREKLSEMEFLTAGDGLYTLRWQGKDVLDRDGRQYKLDMKEAWRKRKAPDNSPFSLFPTPVKKDVKQAEQRGLGNWASPASETWMRPVPEARITSRFGQVNDGIHSKPHAGIDWGNSSGTKVAAAKSGKVSFAGQRKGYGNTVEIDHGNGYKTRYAHLLQLDVKTGEIVPRAKLLGLVGSTGRSTGPHLHFEVWRNNKLINPEGLF